MAKPAPTAVSKKDAHVKGLSKTNRTQSKAQQKLGFTRGYGWAHTAAREGAAYDALPERKR